MKKISLILILIFTALTLCISSVNADDIPSVINKQEDAMKVFQNAKDTLEFRMGMVFKKPFEVKLVTGEEMDEITRGSPYHKSVVGLHFYRDGKHYIFMLKDVGKDMFYGTMCHEMTHGWQDENCPNQSIRLKEGLAMWVEVKVLRWSGAYTLASRKHRVADPIYGVGYKFILEVEDKYGEKGVLPYIVNLKDIQLKN